MIVERKETAVYHGKTFFLKAAVSKMSKVRDEEIETLCRGLELLQCSQDKYGTLAAELLKSLNGIRAKKPGRES